MFAQVSRRHTLLWWTLAMLVVGLVVLLSGTPARGFTGDAPVLVASS